MRSWADFSVEGNLLLKPVRAGRKSSIPQHLKQSLQVLHQRQLRQSTYSILI